MIISEKKLRKIIRNILIEERKKKHLNEIDISSIDPAILAGGAAGLTTGIGAIINFISNKINDSRIKNLLVDFSDSASVIFSVAKTNSAIRTQIDPSIFNTNITIGDVEEWVSQNDRLENFGRNKFGVINRPHRDKERGNKLIYSVYNLNNLKNFNAGDARKLYINSGFKFSKKDLPYITKVYRHIFIDFDEDYDGGNKKLKIIDFYFHLMTHFYSKKYSKKSRSAKKKAEKTLTNIFGKKVDLSSTDQHGFVEIDASNLSEKDLIDVADVFFRHKDSLSERIYMSISSNEWNVTSKRLSENFSRAQRWEFLKQVCALIKKIIQTAGTGGAVIALKPAERTVKNILNIILDEYSENAVMSEIGSILEDSVSKSRVLGEGNFKEFIKFLINVCFA